MQIKTNKQINKKLARTGGTAPRRGLIGVVSEMSVSMAGEAYLPTRIAVFVLRSAFVVPLSSLADGPAGLAGSPWCRPMCGSLGVRDSAARAVP